MGAPRSGARPAGRGGRRQRPHRSLTGSCGTNDSGEETSPCFLLFGGGGGEGGGGGSGGGGEGAEARRGWGR